LEAIAGRQDCVHYAILLMQSNLGYFYSEWGLVIILLTLSALMSGAEVSYFSLSQEDLTALKSSDARSARFAMKLLEKPRILLGAILITDNIFNIGVAILSWPIFGHYHFSNDTFKIILQVASVTFVIVLFGEVLPKIYTSQLKLRFAIVYARPVYLLTMLFYPLSALLSKSTSIMDKIMNKQPNEISLQEIKEAIEITTEENTTQEEKKILRGIINFGKIYVKQIMHSRIDVVAHDISTPFRELIEEINKDRYSRIPIYNEDLDNVKGILYVKDLLPYLNQNNDFVWQGLLREAYFIPPTKKLDDLLQEFKQKKVHLALVVDEFGSTSGLITLEDILEEIVGDIHDEFDDEEISYSRIDESTFIFDGKTMLSDLIKIMELPDETFDEVEEAETIGGLAIEICGKIPQSGEEFTFQNLKLNVLAADNKLVRRVRVTKQANIEIIAK